MLIDDMKAFTDPLFFAKNQLGIDWLWPKQIQILKEFYDPMRNLQNMVLICGMRSGKTTDASIITCYEAFKLIARGTPNKHYNLPKGTEIFIINVATSDRQAKDTVFAHVKARIQNSPWFQKQQYVEHHNEFIFPTRDGKVIIRSEHSNSASLAGKTILMAVFDELSRFKETGGNSSAEMVYDTLSRSVKTFGKDGKKVVITSPMYVKDYAMQLYGMFKGKEHWYCKRWPTWEMNPTITFEDLEDEFEKDPETAWRDWGAVPSASVEVYFKETEKIDNCVMAGVDNPIYEDEYGVWHLKKDWKPKPGVGYILAGDPAFKNDSFGMALGHNDFDFGFPVCDMIHRFEPHLDEEMKVKEIDANDVKTFVLEVAERCDLELFVTDIWNYPETIQAIRKTGVDVEQNHVGKKEYDNLKESMYTGRFGMVYHEMFLEEIKAVELKRGQKIDHPLRGSKDVADAVVNMVWYLRDENYAGTKEEPVYAMF